MSVENTLRVDYSARGTEHSPRALPKLCKAHASIALRLDSSDASEYLVDVARETLQKDPRVRVESHY